MKTAWTHFGPPRETSIAVPPTPSLIDWYALGYDEAAQEPFYICKPDGTQILEAHRFDGNAWHKLPGEPVRLGHVIGGAYDSTRGGPVAWAFDFDYTVRRRRATGIVFKPAATPIGTSGDEPIANAEGEDIGTFDKSAIFAFDRGRQVWVCLTRVGVWELAADGVWTRKADDAGPVPKEWHNKSGDGTYDPVGRRTVFMIQEGEDYAVVAFSWDGSKLAQLSMEGLPELCIGFSDPVAQLSGHPRHGLVLHAGGGRLFAVTSDGWTALPATREPPPNLEDALMTYDAKRDSLMLGPGKHEGAGGSDRHDVFFVLRGDTWQRQGVAVVHSTIKAASYGNVRMGHAGGAWYATGTHSLQTWKWVDDAWKEIVDKARGKEIGGWEILELVGGAKLHAVTTSGAVFALENDVWHALGGKKDAAFKTRTDFAVAIDPNGRLVVWGGEANGRKLNDTLFFEGKKWRAAKKPSPQPADFKHGRKDGIYVGTTMVFDTTLGTMVRFGYQEVAVLQDDEIWKLSKPKGYDAVVSSRKWGHVALHDAGETLLLDFVGGEEARDGQMRVARFDLGGCVEVATAAYPSEVAPKKQHDAAGYHALCQSFSWDATTRSLYAQVLEDKAGMYRLDLGQAFDAAKAVGPRAAPAAAAKPAATKLYRVKDGEVEVLVVKPGSKAKAGYVPAAKLSRAALASVAAVQSSQIKVGKVIRSGALPASHLGGLPSGISAETWPRIRKQPMGFLLQLETGKLLKKHAAVAVFCALDGEATTEEDENAVVLLRAADLKKRGGAPDGVAALPARALEVRPAKLEIDEPRALAIGGADPDLAAAIEALGAAKGMQESNLYNKLGGAPHFLQGDATLKKHVFIAQLDFDNLSVSDAWPDAGLAGCIYIFVRDDESSAVAFWQYT